tara:strand:+ start:774 stop:1565 length:792 start_codon:yes stop_codon:yes gene_type:complete
MSTPLTRTPVRIARGSLTNLTTSLNDLQDGEIMYAEDQNKLYIKDGSTLEALTYTPANAVFTGNATFDTNTLYVDGTNNRVGIGTTSPSNALDIQAGTEDTAIVARSTDAKAQISFVDNTTTAVGHVAVGAEGDAMIFAAGSTSGTERLRINATGVSKFTGAVSQAATAIAASDLDLRTSNYFTKTVAGTTTFTFSNPAASGTVTAFTVEITYTSGTIAWPASVKWNNDLAPTFTTGKTHLFMFITDDGGSRYRGSALVDYVN